jgi:hypothetical protein
MQVKKITMRYVRVFVLFFTAVIFVYGCGRCEKLNLTKSEKDWLIHYQTGQHFLFKNSIGAVDTLQVKDVINRHTPCNKIELSKFQYEIKSVLFIFRSKQAYHLTEPSITMTTEEWQQRIPYIYFGNLGPHRNDLQNKMPVAIDTVLNGEQLTSVYYYTRGLNTELYGEKVHFKNFFWHKESGLLAYTTINDEVFLRVKNK